MTKLILGSIAAMLVMNSASAYIVQEQKTTSNITIREVSKDAFEVLYCKQAAEACIPLGSKPSYSLRELQSVKNK